MITPDVLEKTGSEHGIQAALFAWAAVAEYHGFDVANRFGEPGNISSPMHLAKFATTPTQGVAALRWLHAIPNGGSRGDTAKSRAIRGATMKAEGVRDGVPDVFLPVAVYPYHGLYIEMKTTTGTLRPSQKEFRTFAAANGYAFSVERSWRDAAKLIECYLSKSTTLLKLKEK